MYNDKLVYKVVIWVFYGINLWKETKALSYIFDHRQNQIVRNPLPLTL